MVRRSSLLEPESEGGALAQITHGSERATHGVGESAADRQSESGAVAQGVPRPDLNKRLEYGFQLVDGDSNAAVDDVNRDDIPLGFALERNAATERRELYGIGEEIQHDLLHLRRVRSRGDRRVVAAILVFQVLRLQLRTDQSFHVAQNLVQFGRSNVHLDRLPAFDPGEIEYRRDQSKQKLLALLNPLEVAALRVGERAVNLPLEQLGVSEYRLQRSPE